MMQSNLHETSLMINSLKQPHCLKKHNPTYGQIDSNELCKVNILFVMYLKWIGIIITHAATNRRWQLTLNVY